MEEYMLLMFNDAPDRSAADDPNRWQTYLTALRKGGCFDGGSSIGAGERARKGHPSLPASTDIGGYIRVRAANIDDAKRFLAGNPVYEAGGSIEVRELPRE